MSLFFAAFLRGLFGYLTLRLTSDIVQASIEKTLEEE